MTIDEAIFKLHEIRRFAPEGGAAALYLATPDGLCEVRDIVGESDTDELDAPTACATIEVEPAAFSGYGQDNY